MIIDQKIKKKFIGGYLIDGDINGGIIATTNKPNNIRKIFIWLILGWKWKNIKELKRN